MTIGDGCIVYSVAPASAKFCIFIEFFLSNTLRLKPNSDYRDEELSHLYKNQHQENAIDFCTILFTTTAKAKARKQRPRKTQLSRNQFGD